MVFVVTADQRDSRHHPDAVSAILPALAALDTLRPFERTAGDELQGVLSEPLSVVEVMVALVDTGGWHVGIGVGRVDQPLPDSTRAGRGAAFVAARGAVDLAKRHDSGIEVAVDSPNADHSGDGTAANRDDARRAARDAAAGCQLLADLFARRTSGGREAVRLMRQGATQSEAADRLGITRQAVGQRLVAARWHLERASMPLLTHLLERTDRLAGAGPARR